MRGSCQATSSAHDEKSLKNQISKKSRIFERFIMERKGKMFVAAVAAERTQPTINDNTPGQKSKLFF